MPTTFADDAVDVQILTAERGRNRKIGLAVYVVALWLASAVATAGGIWSVADPRIVGLQLYQVYSDQLATIPAIMITCGILSFVAGVLAMVGVAKGDQKLLGVFMCFISFLLIAWLGIGGYCASLHSTLKSTIVSRFGQAQKYVDSPDPNTPYRAWMLAVQQYMPRCCTVIQLSLCTMSCVPDYTELIWNYLMPTMYGLNFGMAFVSIIGIVAVAVSCSRMQKTRRHRYY